MSRAACNIGVDIGGTKMGAGLVMPESAGDSLIHRYGECPTPKEGEAFLAAILGLVSDLLKQGAACGIGISTAGTVDTDRGVVIGSTANLPGVRPVSNLKELLEKKTGLPVHVENDANAAAYGEYAAGAAAELWGKQPGVVMVTLGTGVGTGIIVHGRIVRGAHYSAGEGGHIAVALENPRLCTCGRLGCWEAYASGNGLNLTIRERVSQASAQEQAPFLTGGKAADSVDTYDLIRALEGGSPLAQHIMDAWHEHIALGIRSLVNVLDPHVVVVGGGLGKFVDFDHLAELVRPQVMSGIVDIRPALLGNKAGLVGAAFLCSLPASETISVGP